MVVDLCHNEFNIQVDITSTKRLGNSLRASSSQTKFQPLLVSVKNPDHAKEIILSARQLLRTFNAPVRNNVLINANLTNKADAYAAYQLRSRRRASAACDVTSFGCECSARCVNHGSWYLLCECIITKRRSPFFHAIDEGSSHQAADPALAGPLSQLSAAYSSQASVHDS